MRAGLYDAKYRLWRLSLSDDKLAFIGSISSEHRKQLGPRTSLSLLTDYEYISSVPSMRYAGGTHPTRIEDDGAFSIRSMLKLNIALGAPRALFRTTAQFPAAQSQLPERHRFHRVIDALA